MSDSTTLQFLQAFGLALVHSIWQGGAIALVTAALLWLARRAAATVRYTIGCVALAAMALAPVFTFVDELSGFSAVVPPAATAAAAALQTPVIDPGAVVVSPGGSAGFDTSTWLPWIVGVWTIGVLVSSVRLMTAWLSLGRLRRRARRHLTPAVAAALARVQAAMGFKPDSRLTVGESEDISTPTVMGWLRPVLLMPFGVLAGLAPSELEAILAHELAHIRRLDHVVNGFQIAAETVFFYHPAVWWVSAEIRREREHCCDDVAVAVAGNRIVYATALAALEEARQQSPALSLAATDGDLVSRVRRILGDPMNTRRHALSMSWAGAILGLAFTTAIVTFAAPERSTTADLPDGAVEEVGSDFPTDTGAAHRPSAGEVRSDLSARQSPAATTETERYIRNEVAIADSQFRGAVASRDLARLGTLLADNFLSTDQDGVVDAKKSFLARIAGMSAFERGSQSVQLDGDLAIVTGSETTTRGPSRERVLVTRVWKRVRPATWQLVSSTQFRDPRPQTAPGRAAAPASAAQERDAAALRRELENLQREYAAALARSGSTQPAAASGSIVFVPTPPAAPPAPAPRAALPPNTVRVGGDIKEPRKIVHVPPIYPAIAKAAAVSGVIILEAVIDESGSVSNLRVLRGHPMLDAAAIDAVQQWKYTPTLINGVPTPLLMTVTVNFSLAN